MSSLSRTLRLAAFAAVCILATGVAAAASAKEETPSGKRDAAAASLEPRSRELDPKGAARMIASPAIRKAPEAEPVRQAEGARIYVEKAEITSVVPKALRSGKPLAITLDVMLASPLSQEQLIPQLAVYIDAEEVLPQKASPSEEVGVPEDNAGGLVRQGAAATTVATTRGPFGISLFVVAPPDLPTDRTLTVSVFSRLDSRQIASVEVAAEAPPPVGTSTQSPSISLAYWITGGLLLLGAGLVLARAIGSARTRIHQLEATVQSERDRAASIARGESAQGESKDALLLAPRPPNLPEGLFEAMARRDVVLVLGTWASAQAGLPADASLWLNVLDRHESRVPREQRDILRRMIASGDSSAAIELLNGMLGRDLIVTALLEEIGGGAESSRFHRMLAGLDLHAVIDTTWDSVAPRAFSSVDAQVFGAENTAELSAAMRSGRVVLLKPLGDVRNPASIALTELEQRRVLASAPEMERALAALFSSRTLLFIGLELRSLERFLKLLPPQLESQGAARHFAIVPKSTVASLWQAGLGQRYGLEFIDYVPSSDHRELLTAMEQLSRRTQRASAGQSAASRDMILSSSRLSTIQLRNIGIFRSLKLEFSPGWTLLLGNNGGGKSTILRAISLALAGNDSRTADVAGRLLRSGTTEGTIDLGIGTTHVLTNLVRDGKSTLVRSPQTTALQAGQVLVLGFPALRGHSTLSVRGPTTAASPNPSVDDLAPLLESRVDDRLDDLKQWVVNTALRVEANPSGRDARMFATFQCLINEMVPGGGLEYQRVDRETWQVILKVESSEVPFDGVSQGMSSILNWVGVLLQRLYEVYPRSEAPEQEPAVVLVDEIDAHLHPEWQRRLVALTKQHFPNVQVIASSHSPLLAGAVSHEELRVVAPNPLSGEVEARVPSEDVSGQKAEDILLSSLFSLQTTRSLEAQRTIERYFELFGKQEMDSSEQSELDDLHARLRSLNYGATLEQRKRIEQMRTQIDSSLQMVSQDTAEALRKRFGTTDEAEQIR